MILYKNKKTGIFNGYITTEKGSTIEAVVRLEIIGETAYDYIIRIVEHSTPYSNELGCYEAHMCMPLGIHKSRLIKWTYTQLELF